jgi:hypothetical protein
LRVASNTKGLLETSRPFFIDALQIQVDELKTRIAKITGK